MATMVILGCLVVAGWGAAAVLGTQAYFRGEQSKPIHARNWNSDEFETLAESVTGTKIDYNERVPGYPVDVAGVN